MQNCTTENFPLQADVSIGLVLQKIPHFLCFLENIYSKCLNYRLLNASVVLDCIFEVYVVVQIKKWMPELWKLSHFPPVQWHT